METTSPITNDTRELIITRLLDAPRDVVYKAWTDEESLKQWWGPKGFDLGVAEFSLQPGGAFHYYMAANGMKMWGKFVYREISAPERMVFTNSFSNEQGTLTRAPFSATWPLEMLNTLTLAERDGKTLMTLRTVPVNHTAEEEQTFVDGIPSMHMGFAGTFEKLEQYLAQVQKHNN